MMQVISKLGLYSEKAGCRVWQLIVDSHTVYSSGFAWCWLNSCLACVFYVVYGLDFRPTLVMVEACTCRRIDVIRISENKSF